MDLLVYLAGPFSIGHQVLNAVSQYRTFHELMDDGIVTPEPPLSSLILEIVRPRTYEDWMKLSLVKVSRCDAVLRLPANVPSVDYFESQSRGADLEEEHARKLNIPIFYSKEDLYRWAKQQSAKSPTCP
jgi:hypothetical protein